MKNNICRTREEHGRRCLLSSHHNMWGKQLSWKVSATPGMTQLNKEPSTNCVFTQSLSLPSNQLCCIHSPSLFERARMPLVLAAPTAAGLSSAPPCPVNECRHRRHVFCLSKQHVAPLPLLRWGLHQRSPPSSICMTIFTDPAYSLSSFDPFCSTRLPWQPGRPDQMHHVALWPALPEMQNKLSKKES